MRGILVALMLVSQCLWAQEWVDLAMYESNGYFLRATSEHNDPNQGEEWFNKRYGVLNLVDGNYTTAWVEGELRSGVGQSVYISLPHYCRSINVHAGYGKSPSLYQQNNRVKRFRVTCHVGINPVGYASEVTMLFKMMQLPGEHYIDLRDVDMLQTFMFPFAHADIAKFTEKVKELYATHHEEPIFQVSAFLQLEIVSVYKGTKYDDTCVSELFFNDTYVADYRNQPYPKVLNVYVDDSNEGQVLIDTPAQKGVQILNDPESVFQVVDISENKRWATIIRMPAAMGEGRVETEYLVVNTHTGKVLNSDIENASAIQLFNPLFLVDRYYETILRHPQGEVILR